MTDPPWPFAHHRPSPGTLSGMSSLPFPVRVAAGLVVAAVEETRDLPRTIAGLPITAVSRVLQLGMRAQQVVTELAIKGDTALDGMRPVEEAPSWARFDDDLPEPPARFESYDVDDTSIEFTDLADAPRVNGHSRALEVVGGTEVETTTHARRPPRVRVDDASPSCAGSSAR